MRKILSHPATLVILLLALVCELALLHQPFQALLIRDYLSAVVPSVVVDLTNRHRSEASVDELATNPLLEQAAQLKAEDMAARGYFSHYSPEGVSPWTWLDRVGYNYEIAGENLAVNYFSSASVARAWMKSPTHRENILRPEFSEIGIGLAHGTYKNRPAVFVVQFFARPR